ncbi:MAG TPA: CidA/LrgA family protein [Alicycliphilus sp.]|jgi:holin-like protein|uniref:CidA/LrgA family protein n=1 Tax=Diaphorobacter limosus TaxID=3036128 RepID=A0ABZ0J4C5_9BURK|nr:CidA/LrgA family protein [Diaphorobacter sp. Y-1]MBP7328381.1 CidA/LrgA family protein [Alicycliphilus sp.]MCA0442250.1 CidA/LrgA family protein [Pseudomonadota bacterium]MBP8778869.1 CidA/LrgA family protein [Alicycliphilus sp.]TXJ13074.1 MAG: CidA/LrgA family protein [Alicycliphilus sp.]WOO31789.1 CidA/LrgA family protein [Diaphorobacter sp. Y-1]
MRALQGMTWLLTLQLVGEALARLLRLPFPGPVVGMLLLVASLHFRVLREPVHAAATYLLSHLSLLFVPVGVGVITHLDLLRDYGVRLMLVIALSTWAGMAVTTLLVRALVRNPQDARKEGSTDA